MAKAHSAGVPGQNWRQAVVVLAWVEMGVWVLSWLVHIMLSMLRCCARTSKAPRTALVFQSPVPSAPTAPDVPAPVVDMEPRAQPQFMIAPPV